MENNTCGKVIHKFNKGAQSDHEHDIQCVPTESRIAASKHNDTEKVQNVLYMLRAMSTIGARHIANMA